MVTRKPAPNESGYIDTTTLPAVPYPTTPIEPTAGSHGFAVENEPKLMRRDSDGSIATNGTWDDSDEEDGYVDVPRPLKIRSNSQEMQGRKGQADGLPAALRPGGGSPQTPLPAALRPGPGPVGGVESSRNSWTTAESSKNPYKLKGAEDVLGESGPNSWQPGAVATPPQPSRGPPPPAEDMSIMSLHDSPTGSYETAEVLNVPHKGMPPFSPVLRQPTGRSPVDSSAFPSSNPWSGIEGHSAPSPSLPPKDPMPLAANIPQHAVQPLYPSDLPGVPPVRDAPKYAPQVQSQQPEAPPPAQNHQPLPGQSPVSESQKQQQQRTPSVPQLHNQPPATQSQLQQQPPSGPPRTSLLQHQATPAASTTVPPTQQDGNIRGELYQVKHIRWWDAASNAMRSSPILTQNANGPCPLLALVNAIVLSTPAILSTPLVDALSDNGNRSQISLGFLLDALFDELTSRRRGETLPDVAELYAFLLALHTGMNVNPRFITSAITPRGSLDGQPYAINNIQHTNRSQINAGAFEETKEMQLYSTLNIPLIHGWIPPPSTPTYAAFSRSAQTFEEAQNIQFLEQDYLALPQLDTRQQQLLGDIRTIKQFLSNYSTQLTEYGLESIRTSLQPGKIAILFRNDHFSTLYKEPRGGALMTLVTDTGYTSHEEIVWESLVDVNGAATEMFSGDFRTVSHVSGHGRVASNEQAGGSDQWEDAQRRYHEQDSGVVDASGRESEIAPPLPGPRPFAHVATMSSTEQADHDFALALQLQEEEEDAQRQADERRRREQELSERFLSSQETPPAIPPRRGSGRRQSVATAARAERPGVSRPAGVSIGGDLPPPSYEQSRTDRMLRPGERPPAPQINGAAAQAGLPEWTVSGSQGGPSAAGRGRGRGTAARGGRGGGGFGGAPNVKDAEDKCVVM